MNKRLREVEAAWDEFEKAEQGDDLQAMLAAWDKHGQVYATTSEDDLPITLDSKDAGGLNG